MRYDFRISLALILLIHCIAFTENPAKLPENVPSLPLDIPKNAVMYTVIGGGKPTGQMALWDEGGAHHGFFQFNDRGRGPKIYSVSRIGSDQIPGSLNITGNDYYKKPVEESYQLEQNAARWKSSAEQGSMTLSAKAFYVAMVGSPDEIAQLARALLANGGKMSLLPAGEARIQRMSDLAIESGAKKKTITGYAISGLDFRPTSLWLDADRTLFAMGDAFFMTIRQGWESSAEKILKTQSESENAYAAQLAGRLTHFPDKPVLFYNVNLFNSMTATVRPEQTVVIRGNKIESVAPSTETDRESKDVQVIDGTGKMLLPGLWDMHVHVKGADGILHLAAGVTTVRDLANANDELAARRLRFENGTEIGPQMISAGIIDGPGPYQGPTSVLVSTPEEARAAVDDYHRRGYPQIKIYSSVKAELVPVIVEQARKNGQRVSGHIPAGMIADNASATATMKFSTSTSSFSTFSLK